MVILEMFIEDILLNGVDSFSLVQDPAMESEFVKLNKQHEIKLKVVDKEKRILMGVAMIPDKLIYRKDFAGYDECKIYFTKESIREISELFFKKGGQNNSSLEHEIPLSRNTIVESWIKEHDVNDKSVMYDIEAPLNSWIVSMKVENDETLKMAEDGIIKGFSIEGLFGMNKVKNSQEIYEEINEIITKHI